MAVKFACSYNDNAHSFSLEMKTYRLLKKEKTFPIMAVDQGAKGKIPKGSWSFFMFTHPTVHITSPSSASSAGALAHGATRVRMGLSSLVEPLWKSFDRGSSNDPKSRQTAKINPHTTTETNTYDH